MSRALLLPPDWHPERQARLLPVWPESAQTTVLPVVPQAAPRRARRWPAYVLPSVVGAAGGFALVGPFVGLLRSVGLA